MYAKISNNKIIEYPSDPRTNHPNVSFPGNWSGGIIESNTYVSVVSTSPPIANAGYFMVEDTPVFANSVWMQVWKQQLIPLDIYKASTISAIDAKFTQISTGGYSYDFSGTTGIKVLSTAPADQMNWLIAKSAFNDAILGGFGSANTNIRSVDDTTITLTCQQAANAISSMIQWGMNTIAYSWSLRDQVNAANSTNEVASINIQDGWPTS